LAEYKKFNLIEGQKKILYEIAITFKRFN